MEMNEIATYNDEMTLFSKELGAKKNYNKTM